MLTVALLENLELSQKTFCRKKIQSIKKKCKIWNQRTRVRIPIQANNFMLLCRPQFFIWIMGIIIIVNNIGITIAANIFKCLLCDRHSSKCFVCINSFNVYDKPMEVFIPILLKRKPRQGSRINCPELHSYSVVFAEFEPMQCDWRAVFFTIFFPPLSG